MAQIFHYSTNTISKVTIFGAVFILGGLGYVFYAVNQSAYYTNINEARQQPVPASVGTIQTHKPLFVGMLVGVILVLVGLTYFPALALGPFAEGLH